MHGHRFWTQTHNQMCSNALDRSSWQGVDLLPSQRANAIAEDQEPAIDPTDSLVSDLERRLAISTHISLWQVMNVKLSHVVETDAYSIPPIRFVPGPPKEVEERAAMKSAAQPVALHSIRAYSMHACAWFNQVLRRGP